MMKQLFSLCLLLILAGCTESSFENNHSIIGNDEFYATIEGTDSRTYVDEQIRMRWNAEDEVTIFKKNTYNRTFMFTGNTGANAGGFRQTSTDDDYWFGYDVDYSYAVYPHSAENTLDETDLYLTVNMPAEQTYVENSFGLNANTMVAVSDNSQLIFKNVGSYLRIRLYGENVAVSSITLTTKGNEAIAGKAKITPSIEGNPTCEMTGTGKSICLTCTEPVTISSDASAPTDFWIVVPPVTLSSGFSVTIKDNMGETQVYDIDKSFTFERNKYYDMIRGVDIQNIKTVHVAEAGTLSSLISEEEKYQITEIKITGNLNGTDIRTLREMAGSDVDNNNTNGQLQILDISKCNIVEGGETYIFSKYTTNNIVGANMFQNCSALKELYLPETITKIDEYAFANCTQLKIFDIPRSVITLGEKLFDGCSSLKDLVIPNNISSWSMLGKTSISNITIENGVKIIPNQAFKQCSDLKKITIPKTVTNIGSEAFTGYTDIREVYVDDLEQWLNYNWEYVRNYGIGSLLMANKGGILYIGGEKIREVTIPNTYTSIPNYAFYGCTNIEAITLPNTLKSIGKKAFGETSIKQVDIPNSVTDIGEGAFQHCSELEKVTMSNMVTKIPDYCFYYCKKLKFQIPSHIQYINYCAFEHCESLEEITIPNGANISSSSIFYHCI